VDQVRQLQPQRQKDTKHLSLSLLCLLHYRI
jgi:hypothetical protein